ncbi:phosphopentomutase isoform X2 [Cylas formicarius]|nr:phosphopentomutase isoform X2 [Cylas formicarius]XP_060529492.1 phosphopentomutase isoform X2 [Cylas formicarius]XP_060529493.1 phosphopentomutase isoform X2 [Cylas formicarius]XP_060529494.1 phosphopentomutase isoform X2 [Cylas formicarius]
MVSNCDAQLKSKIDEWLDWDKNEETRAKLQKLVDENNVEALQKKLLSRLSFGTAGLRGLMDVGYSCMNDLVIIQTAQGFLKFLEVARRELLDENGIIIGYDGRYNSKRWAEITATVFVQAGFPVKLFGDVCPTPLIPFAVRRYKCASGVVVTASHNPKDDNGYKVYDSNGAQIIGPVDKEIQKSILQNLKPLASSWDTHVLKDNKLLTDPQQDVEEAYRKLIIEDEILAEHRALNKQTGLKIVYTAMHGVGYKITQVIFDFIGATITPVPEQRDPHPDFPTVKFPNPEEGKSSLDLAIRTAEANKSPLIFAHDPDADRFAVAEKNSRTGEWKIFSGNELGAIFGYWLLYCFQKKYPEEKLSNTFMISSTVSSMILKTMAKAEGFNFVDTLTGFKWIGNKVLDLEATGKKVIFGFEEAIGFMCDPKIVDKDGISASAHFACCASYIYSKGQQIVDKLEEIYSKYGYHKSLNSYYFCDNPAIIRRIFERIRNWDGCKDTYPGGVLHNRYKIISIRDLTTGYDNTQPGNRAILPVSCSAQMITFVFDNGLHCTLRTSGTEPKIKYYTELCSSPDVTDQSVIEKTLRETVTAICEEFLEPAKNSLIPQSD